MALSQSYKPRLPTQSQAGCFLHLYSSTYIDSLSLCPCSSSQVVVANELANESWFEQKSNLVCYTAKAAVAYFEAVSVRALVVAV